jgi:tetratricopeptide (TPR) repeat protein
MGAALCYIRLGQQYKASRMLANAENFASFLGNENLIIEVDRIYEISIKAFQGKIFQDNKTPMPYKNPYKDLHEEAKEQVDENVRKEFEEFEESRELISFEQYDRCLDCIDKLLKKINEDKDKNKYNKIKAVLLFVKSNIYQRTGRRKEEIEILKQFCSIEKNYPFAEHNLGGAYSKLNNYDTAEKHFLKAIEIMNGNYPLAFCNLGILYTKMGRLEEAKQQLLKAEKSEAPEYPLNVLRKRIHVLKKTKRKK